MARRDGEKQQRQRLIREIIARNQVHSHDQLLALLEVEAVVTTQPTLSRDLRELGAHKTERGYQLEPADAGAAERRQRLRPMLKDLIVSAGRSGTMVVVVTKAGHGHEIAAALKSALGPAVLGVLFDDQTIFIAGPGAAEARATLRWIQEAARLRK